MTQQEYIDICAQIDCILSELGPDFNERWAKLRHASAQIICAGNGWFCESIIVSDHTDLRREGIGSVASVMANSAAVSVESVRGQQDESPVRRASVDGHI